MSHAQKHALIPKTETRMRTKDKLNWHKQIPTSATMYFVVYQKENFKTNLFSPLLKYTL